MKKQSSKPTKTTKSHATFSRVDLCKICSTDARTIDRRAQTLGISSQPRTGPTDPVMFRLTPEQVERLKQPLPRGAFQNGLGSSDLRQEKLQEEVEMLRLKNKKLREASSPNWLIAQILKDLAETVPAILENRLEPYAIQGANKEPAELRSLGKSTNDAIRAEVHSFLEVWSAKWDDLASESRETA
jgi:hypothetical protein